MVGHPVLGREYPRVCLQLVQRPESRIQASSVRPKKMTRTRLIAIGACSIDTILTVPHFPQEDAKLRAKAFNRRRGGNCPNTLEVLQDLLQFDGDTGLQLNLIATLPARTSRDNDFIRKSFGYPSLPPPSTHGQDSSPAAPNVSVNLDHCLYREDCIDAVSSYIIASEATSSRTIVNHNALPEMTFDEFVSITESILRSSSRCSEGADTASDALWFHFEGRIPDTTLVCIRYLRGYSSFKDAGSPNLKISVEIEKPGREGLQALALLADVVFYSKSWAEGEGYTSAEMCLREQGPIIRNHLNRSEYQPSKGQLLVCTWGASGASATTLGPSGPSETSLEDMQSELHVEHGAAYISPEKPIVDTTGAGDTFIAGVLFGLICKGNIGKGDKSWTLTRTLEFANELAGRKILQHGFRVEGISLEPR